jgi:glycosyltransferase involved in cell wall biosynthesis
MDIVFLCPPSGVINGGTKYLYRMAKILADTGLRVRMFEQNGQKPAWFKTDLPVIGQGTLVADPEQVFVLPEDQNPLLNAIKDWPQKKIIYAQNQFYAAMGVGNAPSFADFGVSAILCSSETIRQAMEKRHAPLPCYTIPCSIDREIFKPLPKRKTIAFMPRKRGIEAPYIRDLFRFQYPERRNWDWAEIKGASEADTARMLGESAVFLSLSRLEGFGLTPLEAMAAGCVVAGFTGIGGREYADDDNGFWANEDDFPACLAALKAATDLSESSDTNAMQRYRQSAERVLARYTPETFRRSILEIWNRILRQP